MLDTSRVWWALLGLVVAACATPPGEQASASATHAVAAPPALSEDAKRALEAKEMEEAKALLAQAETDVQRARAKRALWLKAWEDLLAARREVAERHPAAAIAHARRASELAELGLEQLAYPAVR